MTKWPVLQSFESISGCQSEYGVCFVDTSIGKFYVRPTYQSRFVISLYQQIFLC